MVEETKMPAPDSQTSKTFFYAPKTLNRAERSLLCSPFYLGLFEAMRSGRVAMSEIVGTRGVENGYTKRSLSELVADDALVWLIQIGVLRREVDGQGITDSFRLTPLGRQLIEKFQTQPWRTPSWSDRLVDLILRWFRLPF